MKHYNKLLSPLLAIVTTISSINIAHAGEEYYTDEKVFSLRPAANASKDFGHVGPTGILAHIEPGVKVTVTGTQEGTPAAGKFNKGEVIVGVNGKSLKGLNPYLAIGAAITAAESSDGELTFDLESKGQQRKVSVQIPALGTYGENWPVDCPKSKKIIENAAAFYSKAVSESDNLGIPSALPCLFLLSTGDDAHLPVVKGHIQKFIDNPNSIGDHTWNNGFNGIMIAEYYFRTGEAEVLPLLQAICDDARDRQNFDSAWKHWGSDINPSYVGGGLMNPASTQVLTTLIMSKEAGVNVDEKTLNNALKYFWRFAGHGSVPYGDHRGEGGVGSNGKDAMLAVAMQVASDASGDTSIYQSARDHLSMATLEAYPDMIMGHADNGRGDGIWRGIASSYLIEKDSKYYREVMDRITWWYDLSRFANGAMGLASCVNFNDSGSGAGAAMTFTAPLKTLRITGAPRSKFAKEFTLPERIWGNEADLAFHSIKPAEGFEKYGKPLTIYQIDALLGSAYSKGSIATDPDSVSLDQLKRLVRHRSYRIRAVAARALRIKGELKVLEELLKDPDPRLRRASLDGIINWGFFGGGGRRDFLLAESFTPGMIETITAMLTNPKESEYVVEGALFAVGCMPAEVIKRELKAILPWTKHKDWWFRHASFVAIQGLEKDPELYIKVIPILTDMMTSENHTMPRGDMNIKLALTLRKYKSDSEIGKLISKGFNQSMAETEVIEGRRSREGHFNVIDAMGIMTKMAPETAPQLAAMIADRGLADMDNDELLTIISGARLIQGLLHVRTQLKGAPLKELDDVLYEKYRPELSKRLKAQGGTHMETIDAVLALIQLRDKTAGWKPIGSPNIAERNWQFTSFEPTAEKDILPRREGRRYREVDLPSSLKDWFKPEFDASDTSVWKSGKAPIGKGSHPRGPKNPEYPSTWGDGEILLARTTFELDKIHADMYRVRTLCSNGFSVYLNGQKIRTYTWWKEPGDYAIWPMGKREVDLLRKGTNTLAVYAHTSYPSAVKPNWTQEFFAESDVYIEALNKEDLY